MTNIREVRDYAKTKAHLMKMQRPDPMIDLLRPMLIMCLKLIRNDYARQIGMKTYLSQMLLTEATAPMGRCTLIWSGGRPKLRGMGGQQVQRYIVARCGNDLPDIVMIRLEDGKEVERYL